ncbi:hypothetical protein [Thiohalomonas denitrificans]|uniref:Electron transfer flavoprotein domain-containing protein n=1 Tax=Thiohalomonas denitrificans TaxID=415747 RepID=A0A1G5Q9G7_9GAMM|nr:hypothetical protein [Thiohalomonas denitrificans]SCZ58021.1 hypothetical protein SAMN03097708_01579 [Thiohalomonas denitrificans]
MQKQILIVALDKRSEALRMAAGLTLLDDPVKVALCGEAGADAEEHLEALDFADVPVQQLEPDSDEGMRALAREITTADAVYIV